MKNYTIIVPLKGQALIIIETKDNEDIDTIKMKAFNSYLNNEINNLEFKYSGENLYFKNEED